MQSIARLELHKVRHWCSTEMSAGRLSRLPYVYICLNHRAACIHVVAVKARSMIFVFSDHSELPGGSRISFPTRGNMRLGYLFTSPQQICLLVSQSHNDGSAPLLRTGDMRSHEIVDRAASSESCSTEADRDKAKYGRLHTSKNVASSVF